VVTARRVKLRALRVFSLSYVCCANGYAREPDLRVCAGGGRDYRYVKRNSQQYSVIVINVKLLNGFPLNLGKGGKEAYNRLHEWEYLYGDPWRKP
jgi:hypothetical protein